MDRTNLKRKDDLIYLAKCPQNTSPATCMGETGRTLNELIVEHAMKEQIVDMLKHKLQDGHPSISSNKFTIIRRRSNLKEKGRYLKHC